LKLAYHIGVILTLFIATEGKSQVLPIDLEPIIIPEQLKQTKTLGLQKLHRNEIQTLQTEDIGTLMQRFAGVSMKNYGGLGGLKTMSVRGLSGSHSVICVDGFSIQNTQAGQLDLSTVQSDNVESISLHIGGKFEQLLPVSAYLGGNSVHIKTFENTFSVDTFQLRFQSKIGSFSQFDNTLSIKWGFKKSFLSFFAKHRKAASDYPFQFHNGNQLYTGIRENNQLEEQYGGIHFGIRPSTKSLLKFSYQGTLIDKGLPGAVILYNSTANQYLKSNIHQFNADYRYVGKQFIFRTYLSNRYDEMIYTDSSYLNLQGFLRSQFFQNNAQQGVLFQYKKEEKRQFTAGIEHTYSTLHARSETLVEPSRYHVKSFLQATLESKSWETTLQVAGEFLSNQLNQQAKQEHAFTPSIHFQKKTSWKVFGTPFLGMKRSFRMPSFNEMYYNHIGNIHLKPEKANQFYTGIQREWEYKSWTFQSTLNAYFNLVEDKIIAMPTKNVFIWSMQNVGLVQIIGTDLQIHVSKKINQSTSIQLNSNYTFQHAVDVVSRESQTFGHQIPYVPKHSSQLSLTFTYKNSGINISSFTNSKRFALSENIASNEIAGFTVLDAAVFHTFKLKANQSLRFQLNARNVTNQSYAFVRYFVMPGINFIGSIALEL
jgi:vitamin B12 transporter